MSHHSKKSCQKLLLLLCVVSYFLRQDSLQKYLRHWVLPRLNRYAVGEQGRTNSSPHSAHLCLRYSPAPTKLPIFAAPAISNTSHWRWLPIDSVTRFPDHSSLRKPYQLHTAAVLPCEKSWTVPERRCIPHLCNASRQNIPTIALVDSLRL